MENMTALVKRAFDLMRRVARERLPKPVRDLLISLITAWRNITGEVRAYQQRKRLNFEYSKKWYDEVYHSWLPNVSYKERMQYCEEAGYKKRLVEVFNSIEVKQEKQNWLEVACHHGKTAFWLAENFRSVKFWMFDFSDVAVNWCKRNNPISDRAVIWCCDCTRIQYEGDNFDDYFDLVTCIDVTEHVPPDVYLKMITELYRVTKPGGLLVLMQGTGKMASHIHVLPEEKLVEDFCAVGFILIKELPHRHHLFQKPD